jgi:hypothetical protein
MIIISLYSQQAFGWMGSWGKDGYEQIRTSKKRSENSKERTY